MIFVALNSNLSDKIFEGNTINAMKKHSLILITFFLAACGPSQEEKQQIATVTCNVMAESTTMDGAMKIKEVNQAREQIGEPPFLAASDEIQESLRYEVCESLVINDPNYLDLLSQAKILAEEKFKNLLKGFWLHETFEDDGRRADDVFTMQVTNDTIEISRYEGWGTLIEKATFSFDQTSESELTVKNKTVLLFQEDTQDSFEDISGSSIFFDQKNNELSLRQSDLNKILYFTRSPNLTDKYFNGVWSFMRQYENEESRYKIEITDEETTLTELVIFHDAKTFKKGWSDTFKSDFENGFIFSLQSDGNTYYDFVKEGLDGVSNWGYSLFGEVFTMKRQNSNYEISIPAGYVLSDQKVLDTEETLKKIGSALRFYRLDCFAYPPKVHGLKALMSSPPSGLVLNWNGPYLNEPPKDAWGNDFLYDDKKGFPYLLFSTGADGKVGGEGNDSDIYYEPYRPPKLE